MILLTGATGFTGRYVAETLHQRDMPFRCLIRNRVKAEWLSERGIPLILGDINDASVYPKALENCTGIINLVSFKEDHIGLLIREAHKAQVQRVVFIGTTAIFTHLNAESKTLRQRIEREITKSGLAWTLLRPTMIYGAPGDRNMERLIKAVKRFYIQPILGSGNSLIQPIHVRDLAQAIVDAYNCPKASRRAFNLSGKEALTYRQAVEEVGRLAGRRPLMIRLPLWAALTAVAIARRIPGLPHLKNEQVLRLNEDKSFDHSGATSAWGFDPMGFTEGVRYELRELGISPR